MARTSILPTDPTKRKAWAAAVANDGFKDQYFSRMIGAEGEYKPGIKKTDTEKGAGDEVTTTLTARLRGQAVREGQKLAGKEMKLSTASHTMRVNEHRHGVNVGARIEQMRVGHNLKATGRKSLTEYIKALYEETTLCAVSGARGVADDFDTLEPEYAGYPNALRAPDAAHLFTGTDNSKTKATLTASDKLTLATVNKLRTKAKKMIGGGVDKPAKMQQAEINGQKLYLLATTPEGLQDIRDDVSAQGWFEAQKAVTTKLGKESELFKGGAGIFNGVLIDEMETGVYFNDYGSGGNVAAARSLFMGAGAFAVAHGTKGMADGMTVQLDEDTDDRGHDSILFFEMIFGADKVQYQGKDFGVIAVDHAYTLAV